MKKQRKSYLPPSLILLSFLLWTLAVMLIDVKEIGPCGSSVGFATLNGFFHKLTGVHMTLYVITDWLSLIPIFFVMGFAVLGLIQWIKRKKLFRVDADILALGVFYVAVLLTFIFFELFIVNYRPILIGGILEASYPSSTTLIMMCVMPTAVMQLNKRIKHNFPRRSIAVLLIMFTVFAVLCRLISGVHWFTDIIGGALFSLGAVLAYYAVCVNIENGR